MKKVTKLNGNGSGSQDMRLYQLKITLKGSDPAIWRRVVVRSDTPLDILHAIIQCVMPWEAEHMHQFIAGHTCYAEQADEVEGMDETLDEAEYTLADLAPAARKKFVYEYDFGDGWEHEVEVEKVLPPDPSFKDAVCVAGANACPPEDCGGIQGFYRLLEVLADPDDPEHEEMAEWVGDDWDAKRFDLARANADLKRLKQGMFC
jgi:hypothetical protein